MRLSAENIVHFKPGRKRAPNRRRSPDGKSNGERPEDIQAIAKAQRIKNGAIETDYNGKQVSPIHELNGSTLGQLTLEGSISTDQRYVGLRYASIILSYSRVLGIPSPFPRGSDLLSPTAGLSCGGDYTEEEANRIKARFRDCRHALLECGKDLLVGSAINRIIYGVIVEDWPRHIVGTADIQNLRCGLNALDRVMKTWDKRST